jgi:2-amino-4-hydroxy-6-hydroxymethyldihydropteridine diphosphokinase
MSPHWAPAYIGVGSNLDSPAEQVRRALKLLGELPGTCLIAASGLYRSAPLCGQDQPDYINAVAAVLTQMSAIDFLRQLHELEARQGRTRSGKRWEARVLDLDLLAFGDQRSDTDELKLPHPGIAERNFVLLPWNEIAPHYVVPALGDVRKLAAGFLAGDKTIEKLS